MLWLPRVEKVAVIVALVPLLVPDPIDVPPSLNVIVPVRPFEIVAVRVTAPLTGDGFCELDSVRVGVAGETV